MSRFDEETRVVPAADGRWAGTVSPAWNIGTNPNGGYLMALAVAAIRQALPAHPDPLSVTVHYLKPGVGGEPFDVDLRVLRTGRQIGTVRATLSQGGEARLEVLAAMGALAEASDAPLVPPPPGMPPPHACVARSAAAQGIDMAILDRVEVRLHPDDGPGGGGGRARGSGGGRVLDGREPDALAALVFADAYPPAVFGLLGAVGWVPTVELTVQVRRRPAPGWMLARFETVDMVDGRLIEDGLLWDSQGHLVAQSRQLALVRGSGPRG
jgi:acyl-CoA thioesterase